MAEKWTCPHCKGEMYSAWPKRDEPTIRCEYCKEIFDNPYYQDIDALLKEHHERPAL
jgi:hypothetical protein